MNEYEAKQERRRERLERAAERATRESDAQHRRSRELVAGIPFGQPILVGHHSEKRHRRAVDRSWDALGKAVEADKRAQELAARAAAVGTGGISSDDPDAIDKLREKLAGECAKRDMMKAANKAYKAAVTAGVAGRRLDELSVETVQRIAKASGLPIDSKELAAAVAWVPAYSFERGPFVGWPLQNLSANIRRIEERIAELEKRAKDVADLAAQGSAALETVVGAVRIVKNLEANRVQVFFPGKPAAEVRSELKANGFRWAPSEGAWQRHLSGHAAYLAEQIATRAQA